MNGYKDEFRDRRASQEAVNDRFLKALEREQKGYLQKQPDSFVWAGHYPINREVQKRYQSTNHTSREILAETLRVDRDPCTYCGTRRDLGCSHHEVQA